ncbi:M23 family metallopeptidase [Hydrogenophaga sp.]|uniref:M23 family metallopeptidase n=1 Tax=Hydrogenophaga sp. TaxID=1904254 RepID=UPI0025BA4456|nr:M23 family metallopeptidase [Hydrogenophaga sp.]
MIKSSLTSLFERAQSARQSILRHPRRVMAGVGALLLGTGVTAFGIAPLVPTASNLPVTQVVESLSLGPLSIAPLSAPSVPLTLYRSENVRRDDSPQSLLQRLGVNDPAALRFLRSDASARLLFGNRGSTAVTAQTNDRGELLRLTARWLPSDENLRSFNRLQIERQGQEWVARLESGELSTSTRLSGGLIRSSLFAATDAANIPDAVAVQLAELFSNEIDFRNDLRAGDRFSVVYEVLQADGQALGSGRLLSAEFINNKKSYAKVWFGEPGTPGAYFGFDGQMAQQRFLASPLQFTRVSSGFGMRFHPVHGVRRAHLGVDFAAPTGTPVRTVSDGVVQFVGFQRGFGNVVFVQHEDDIVTVYAHLSRMDVRRGQRLSRGENLGAVGCTGTCTGPHLHFEIHENGVPLDPLLALRNMAAESVALNPQLQARFDAVAQAQRQKLDAASTLQQASAE